MPETPYFGTDPNRRELREVRTFAGYFYTIAMNACLTSNPEKLMLEYLSMWQVELFFSLQRFWFCLSGISKPIYFGVYGWRAEDYLEVFDRYRLQTEKMLKQNDYCANVFMILEGDVKQMAVLFSPGKAPRCTPQELAGQINILGQSIYEETIFKGDTRYCNVTALSGELHGYTGIREGYLQTRKLSSLNFFHMEPKVVTEERVTRMRNGADYRVIMGECNRLQQILDQGDITVCRKQWESLMLKTVKGSYSWTSLQDALSFCKHMLELRCTVRGLCGIDLENLCAAESYLRIEECTETLWGVLERLCTLIGEQGPYQDLMLRAIYYIKLHYAEDISLTDVAAYANVNSNYLSGSFQKEMGLSVREFITNQRMEAAKRLLRQENMRISDVAEAVGVHDVKYFGRLFKKAEGMTPGEYRENKNVEESS